MGTGHIGAWLTEELCHDHEVAVYDRDPRKLKYFFKVRRLADIAEIADFNPEFAFNCVSLQNTERAFDEMLAHVGPECVVCDVTSVKGSLPEYYRKAGRPFASTHPMFGPTFANIRDLSGESAVVISESCAKGREFLESFYASLRVKTFSYSFDEHDRVAAYSLSTPFASTMVFAACLRNQEAPGTTFKRHMDIARGLLSEDDYLLSEIMFNPYTLERIESINQKLSYLTHIVKARDYEEMAKFLAGLRENIGRKPGV